MGFIQFILWVVFTFLYFRLFEWLREFIAPDMSNSNILFVSLFAIFFAVVFAQVTVWKMTDWIPRKQKYTSRRRRRMS